jgi:hypothetical protein
LQRALASKMLNNTGAAARDASRPVLVLWAMT